MRGRSRARERAAGNWSCTYNNLLIPTLESYLSLRVCGDLPPYVRPRPRRRARTLRAARAAARPGDPPSYTLSTPSPIFTPFQSTPSYNHTFTPRRSLRFARAEARAGNTALIHSHTPWHSHLHTHTCTPHLHESAPRRSSFFAPSSLRMLASTPLPHPVHNATSRFATLLANLTAAFTPACTPTIVHSHPHSSMHT